MEQARASEAKFSTQFVLSTCLVRGRFGLAELLEQTLRDTDNLALAAKFECQSDPEALCPRHFSGGVEIRMRDGRTFRHHEKVNRGAGDRARIVVRISGSPHELQSVRRGCGKRWGCTVFSQRAPLIPE